MMHAEFVPYGQLCCARSVQWTPKWAQINVRLSVSWDWLPRGWYYLRTS